jgi:hypothetical protein
MNLVPYAGLLALVSSSARKEKGHAMEEPSSGPISEGVTLYNFLMKGEQPPVKTSAEAEDYLRYLDRLREELKDKAPIAPLLPDYRHYCSKAHELKGGLCGAENMNWEISSNPVSDIVEMMKRYAELLCARERLLEDGRRIYESTGRANVVIKDITVKDMSNRALEAAIGELRWEYGKRDRRGFLDFIVESMRRCYMEKESDKRRLKFECSVQIPRLYLSDMRGSRESGSDSN